MSQARTKMMLNKLMVEVAAGRIEGDWNEKFISDMHEKSKLDYYPYSEKQIAKIEELFDKY